MQAGDSPICANLFEIGGQSGCLDLPIDSFHTFAKGREVEKTLGRLSLSAAFHGKMW
ncbi:hypothetical protein CDAR_232151, partial [Caerostris darwini]